MAWQELSQTLLQLVKALQAPEGTGLTVEAADIEMPMEVTCAWRDDDLTFFARPPHTRWQSGFLPQVHRSKLKVELTDFIGNGPNAVEKGGSA